MAFVDLPSPPLRYAALKASEQREIKPKAALDKALGAAEGPEHAEVTARLAQSEAPRRSVATRPYTCEAAGPRASKPTRKGITKLSRKQAAEYIYGTARELGWDWSTVFDDIPTSEYRKRIPKGCYRLAGPGSKKAGKRATGEKSRRKATPYNQFVGREVRRLNADAANAMN